jgi:hypothetical protein
MTPTEISLCMSFFSIGVSVTVIVMVFTKM